MNLDKTLIIELAIKTFPYHSCQASFKTHLEDCIEAIKLLDDCKTDSSGGHFDHIELDKSA